MDPFARLGLAPTASPDEIKSAYRAAARRLHPDVGGDEQAFQELTAAFDEALGCASGTRPNPYLPDDQHRLYVSSYDRHAHSPAPPSGWWGPRLFWILPVAGVIFMVSGATGRYFLPVWLGSMAVLGLVAWLTIRRGKGLAARRRG